MAANLVQYWLHTADNWYTISFDEAHLETGFVRRIYFVAHANEENSGYQNGATYDPPRNHWTFALDIDTDVTVSVDVVPGEPNDRALVILDSAQSTPNYSSPLFVHWVICPIAPGTTVADILAMIISNKRDRYRFAPLGEGDRFWLAVFAADLEKKGILYERFTAHVLLPALMKYWRFPRGSGTEQRTMGEGRFVD